MQHPSDAQLLRDYAAHGSDPAFAGIVERHTDLVYSAALRQTGSPELARDLAQSVFTDLARKAGALARPLDEHASLAGWLYQATRFAVLTARREERRRLAREKMVMEQFDPAPAPDDTWAALAPVLDEAMAELGDADREAVVLRYFKNLDFSAVAVALGVSEAAAQKRVSRAVERLRDLIAKRGVTTGASGLVVLISAHAVLVAPAGLSAAIAVSAVAVGGVAASGIGAQLAALAGRFSLPTVGASVLLLGTVAILALREARAPDNAQAAVTAATSATPLGKATTAPDQNTARATNTANPAVAIPLDTTLRDWALKLYSEGEELKNNEQFEEALAKYNMAAVIIESGLPPERWMADLYWTRGRIQFAPTNSDSIKSNYYAQIDGYTKSLGIEPNVASVLQNRAHVFAMLKQYAEANADFTRLIEDATVDYSRYQPGVRAQFIASAYENRGRMWLDASRPADAIPDLQNAAALYDKSYAKVRAQFHLATAYKATQQREQLVAEANSMSEQAFMWATRAGSTDEEQNSAKGASHWANELLDRKASYQLEAAAAVQAKLGYFPEAVEFQLQALRELPAAAEGQRGAMQARLELYRASKSLVAP